MKNYLICLGIFLVMFGCGNSKQNQQDLESGVEVANSGPSKQCYAYLHEGDTVRLEVERIEKEKVKGKLLYKLFEKDENKGTFSGVLKGDTLLADYNFTSEGKESVREVAFLFKDNLVSEGYGPLREDSGKMIFASKDSLVFGKGIVLLKAKCTD
ncbi:hypothetical protein [Echinicola sp. 20G]|uniref:hypothetical protein n=1 Tax=Echinicola sp. 20G TaxID=2781961 RepID=UPI0019101A4B|nr:hypothetical protein [Echinicola sp. 20G]